MGRLYPISVNAYSILFISEKYRDSALAQL